MKRYTYKALEHDLNALNAKLEEAKHDLRFVIGSRYGYTAIDLATPQQIEKHCCQRMLIGGTPRECLDACWKYIGQNL